MSVVVAPKPTSGTGMTWLTPSSIRRFLRAEEAFLLLVQADCPHCARLVAAVQAQLERPELRGLNVGTIVLDRPESRRFRCDNPWLGALDVFPYLVRYRSGRRVAGVPASRADLLLKAYAASSAVELARAA
jgi:hypothetical protein